MSPARILAAALATALTAVPPATAQTTPTAAARKPSPGHTRYFLDPVHGDNQHSGRSPGEAWRGFAPLNALALAPGDRVEVTTPGAFDDTPVLSGGGTAADPVIIRFAPGRYDFRPDAAWRGTLAISNSNDAPAAPKPAALVLQDASHIRLLGNRSSFFVHGRMIEVLLQRCNDLSFAGLTFDYHRPLVSEFTVARLAADHADVRIPACFTHIFENGRLIWTGEGWRSAGTALNQECDPSDSLRCWRRGSGPLNAITRAEPLPPDGARLFFTTNPGLTEGHVIQFRETVRDIAGGFIERCNGIRWKNCAFRSLGGMGIVHQFSSDLSYDQVEIAPSPDSGRTTAAWADMLHFSGCRGSILIDHCRFSGSHDDPVNVHGTHLRITGRPEPGCLRVRFMHPQTFGFPAFQAGDDVGFVNHQTLLPYATNRIASAEMAGDREMLLRFTQAPPETIGDQDVLENISWTPSVTIRGCHVSCDSCRGFLITTRKPVIIEDNTFVRTGMSAILIADDANSWFESGPVRDVTIRRNRFLRCAEPVILIAPENHRDAGPVHHDIRILDNQFELTGNTAVSAKSTDGLTITGNRFSTPTLPIRQDTCTRVVIERNHTATHP